MVLPPRIQCQGGYVGAHSTHSPDKGKLSNRMKALQVWHDQGDEWMTNDLEGTVSSRLLENSVDVLRQACPEFIEGFSTNG